MHQISHVPSSKVGGPRSKSVYKSKVKDSAKKAPAKQKSVRPIPGTKMHAFIHHYTFKTF